MADDAFRLVINGKTYEVKPEEMELGEIELLEDEMDSAVEDIDFGRAKAMRVLVYILMHRDNAAFTMEDASQIRMSDLQAPEDEKPKRPTKAAASG